MLHLQVLDPMGITIDMPSFVCADDDVLSVGYDFPNGMRKPMQYSVQFTPTQSGLQDRVDVMLDTTENMIDIELPAGIRPNSYTATFTFTDTASVCGDVVIPAQFDVRYSASLLQPKFNNFIAVQNAENNGGYEFVEVKWSIKYRIFVDKLCSNDNNIITPQGNICRVLNKVCKSIKKY
mgnify:CR=1 FL=1